MPRYRRATVSNARYFFTVVTQRRQAVLCDEPMRHALRSAIESVRAKRPFAIDAWVLLPDHLHCIWTLPEGDADYIHFNPVKHGYAQTVAEWPFLTLHRFARDGGAPIRLVGCQNGGAGMGMMLTAWADKPAHPTLLLTQQWKTTFLHAGNFDVDVKNIEKPMLPKIIIRPETDADVEAINDVTVAAFKTLDISNHTEQFIIAALRAAGCMTVSLVAEVDGRVAGHIAISPVTISDGTGNWYGLGPLSVLPEYQRQGIGKALVEEGLSHLKRLNARGVCLAGHPDYYRKFGFKNVPGLVHEGVPPEFFFALSFDGHIPKGTVTFHDAFKADG